jgi:predicted DNA-binding transcriptional regulator YafY
MENNDSLFVLRRAFLFGVCRRADVNRACGTEFSPNRASAIMRAAITRWHALLYSAPHRGVFPREGAACPKEADASLILSLIAKGAAPSETGVFPDDGAPILMPNPKPARALRDGATQVVLSAALHERPLRILYVGLRRGESARWRRVWPRAMEFTGLQWRLHAQDMEAADQGFPIKVFMLSRIMDAQPLSEKDASKGFTPKTLVRQDRVLRVSLSEDLTPDQVQVVRSGFGIQDGRMTWPDHSLHEFKRDFTREPPNPDVVWPTITRLDILE